MAFREVRVFEVREVLRLWAAGEGLRSIERLTLVDRKTVRRYVGMVVEAVRPRRCDAPWPTARLAALGDLHEGSIPDPRGSGAAPG